MDSTEETASAAKAASRILASCSAAERTQVLEAMVEALGANKDAILAANALDCDAFSSTLSTSLLDRLRLSEQRFDAMQAGVAAVAQEPDCIGECLEKWERPGNIEIERRRVPIGVVAVIYESRPNVTADAAAICLRSGNVALLRGGKEARRTNHAIAEALQSALVRCGLPKSVVSMLPAASRDEVRELLQLEGLVDLVIPRGGEGLIRAVSEQSKIPVLKHYKGVCHLYIDAEVDAAMACSVVANAKVQRPGVCNAVETILLHADVASSLLPRLAEAMPEVELRGCEKSCAILDTISPASDADWSAEYLDLILSCKVVNDFEEAIAHIDRFGSGHTDGIISSNDARIVDFANRVDTSVVVCNASTRFNDGGEFGKGAEIGISTDKLHARGPVGARELTTYKYVLTGQGSIRQ